MFLTRRVPLFVALVGVLALFSPARAGDTSCHYSGAQLASDCDSSWDRLWDIRWRVCSSPLQFGFGEGKRKNAFVTNDGCAGRGIFFGSDQKGNLNHCWDATEAAITTCLLNESKARFASATSRISGELYQTIRYLRSDGSPVPLSRNGPSAKRRDTAHILWSGTQADQVEVFIVKPGRG